MVGPPKYLSDLAKIEADVRVICRACGYEVDWDREGLARWILQRGGSTVWTEITRGMVCPKRKCKSTNHNAIAVPFSRRAPNEPVHLRPIERKVIEVALEVLRNAAARSPYGPVGTPSVRLALYALKLFLPDRQLLAEFWDKANNSDRPARSRGQRLTAASGVDSRLAFGGRLGRADRAF